MRRTPGTVFAERLRAEDAANETIEASIAEIRKYYVYNGLGCRAERELFEALRALAPKES